MSTKRKIVLIVFLGFIGSVAFGYFMYNKPHQNMAKAKVEVTTSSTDLFAEYEANETTANEKFLGKIVEVTGVIQEVQMDGAEKKLILEGDGMMFGVICNMDELIDTHRTDFKAGNSVTLKCTCSGLLMDVVMKRCVEVAKK